MTRPSPPAPGGSLFSAPEPPLPRAEKTSPRPATNPFQVSGTGEGAEDSTDEPETIGLTPGP